MDYRFGAVAVALLFGLGCSSKKDVAHPVAPEGREVVPVVVTMSTFWSTLDQEACPLISTRDTAPQGYESAWPGLRTYCTSSPRTPEVVSLAGQLGREAELEKLTAALRGDVKKESSDRLGVLCKELPARSYSQRVRILLDQVCATMRPTTMTLADLKAAALELDESSRIMLEAIDPLGLDLCRVAKDPRTDLGLKIQTLGIKPSCDAKSITSFRHQLEDTAKQVHEEAAFAEQVVKTAELLTDNTRHTPIAPAGASWSVGSASTLVDVALRGLAQFLVKRAELELRSYAIDKLRKIAQCDKRLDESVVHRLLGHTCEFLGEDSGSLPAGFGPGLRSAFTHDLTNLPRNIAREVPAQGGSGHLLARLGIESVSVLIEDPEPMQVIVRVLALASKDGAETFTCSGTPEQRQKCFDTKAALYLAAVVAREVFLDGEVIHLDGAQLLGRVAGRLRAVRDALHPESSLHAVLSSLPSEEETARLLVVLDGNARAIVDQVKAARASFVSATTESAPLTRARLVAVAVRHSLRALDRAVALGTCIEQIIKTKKAIVCKSERAIVPVQIAEFLDAIADQDIAGMTASALAMARVALASTNRKSLLTPDVARLLSFGAEFANAKTKEEAAAAIEAIAMPPGGYKEKRKRTFFSITGLVGVGGGYEWVSKEPVSGTSATLVGMVGLDYNKHFDASEWTFGVYVPILDLGGIMNVSSLDDADDKRVDSGPKVGVAQVFAPGVGIRVGVGDSPLVLMAGAQIVPNARTVIDGMGTLDTSDDSSRERAIIRAMLSLAVDVTIWSF